MREYTPPIKIDEEEDICKNDTYGALLTTILGKYSMVVNGAPECGFSTFKKKKEFGSKTQ